MARSSRRWLIAGLAALLLAGLALVGSGAFSYRWYTTSTTPGGQTTFDALSTNTSAVIAVDLGKFWKSPSGQDSLKHFIDTSPFDETVFAENFGMPITALDRITVIVPLPEARPIPSALIAVSTTQPIDWKKITSKLPMLRPIGSDKTKPDYYVLGTVEAHPLGDRSVVIIPMQSPAMANLLADIRKGGADNPLERARQALGSHTAILDASLERLRVPQFDLRPVDEPIPSLLTAQRLRLSLDLGDELQADARLTYADATAAQAGESALRETITKLQFGLQTDSVGGVPTERMKTAATLVDRLAKAKVNRVNTDVGMTITSPVNWDTFELFSGPDNPLSVFLSGASRAMMSQNNLKQIMLAVHNYESVYGQMPGNLFDKTGKPLLSWRVALLPYLEQNRLHKQFKLDEPWDSPHNKRLLTPTPRVFLLPGQDADAGLTHYLTFTGPGTAFDADGKPTLQAIPSIADGTSNTLFALEAAEGVPWTKPIDLPFDKDRPLPKVGGHFGPNRVNAVFFDGWALQIRLDRGGPDRLKPAITVAGGEIVNVGE